MPLIWFTSSQDLPKQRFAQKPMDPKGTCAADIPSFPKALRKKCFCRSVMKCRHSAPQRKSASFRCIFHRFMRAQHPKLSHKRPTPNSKTTKILKKPCPPNLVFFWVSFFLAQSHNTLLHLIHSALTPKLPHVSKKSLPPGNESAKRN